MSLKIMEYNLLSQILTKTMKYSYNFIIFENKSHDSLAKTCFNSLALKLFIFN